MKKKQISPTRLCIKNMVCDRCIRVVREELEKSKYRILSIELGEVILEGQLSVLELATIATMLHRNGFELIEDREAQIIEKIKSAVINFVHHYDDGGTMKIKYSDHIAQTVGRDYHSLSVLFSSVENTTIEQYIIRQKIERVKELIKYDDKSLSEIAYMMGYSSVQHLSGQFKKNTGFTPSEFKHLKLKRVLRRIALDKVK